jgi:hypothetical protein
VPPGGTGGPAPDCSSFDAGATTGPLTFRAVIQDRFADTFPSGDPSVDQGDVLDADATVDGTAPSAAELSDLRCPKTPYGWPETLI